MPYLATDRVAEVPRFSRRKGARTATQRCSQRAAGDGKQNKRVSVCVSSRGSRGRVLHLLLASRLESMKARNSLALMTTVSRTMACRYASSAALGKSIKMMTWDKYHLKGVCVGGRGMEGASHAPALRDEVKVEVACELAGGQCSGQHDGLGKAVVQHFELVVSPVDNPFSALAVDLHAVHNIPLRRAWRHKRSPRTALRARAHLARAGVVFDFAAQNFHLKLADDAVGLAPCHASGE